MSRSLLHPHLPYLIEPTPEQYDLGVKHTVDLVRRARDICKQLDIPVSELRTVARVLYEQTGMIVNVAESVKIAKRQRAEHALLDKLYGSDVEVGEYVPVRPIGGRRMKTLDVSSMSDEELNKHLKDAGLDTI